jgi:hypothetical protein
MAFAPPMQRSVQFSLGFIKSTEGVMATTLAAALVWCRERPKQGPFVCFDEDLRGAATILGYSVRP